VVVEVELLELVEDTVMVVLVAAVNTAAAAPPLIQSPIS